MIYALIFGLGVIVGTIIFRIGLGIYNKVVSKIDSAIGKVEDQP